MIIFSNVINSMYNIKSIRGKLCYYVITFTIFIEFTTWKSHKLGNVKDRQLHERNYRNSIPHAWFYCSLATECWPRSESAAPAFCWSFQSKSVAGHRTLSDRAASHRPRKHNDGCWRTSQAVLGHSFGPVG